MLRSFLLLPCLLIGLACATQFPLDSLEEGMTMVQATEAFGEPSSTRMEESNEEVRLLHEEVQLLQEENARIFERLESAVGLSETRGSVERKLEESTTLTLRSLEAFVAELVVASGEQGVRSTWVYPYEELSWMGNNFIVKKEVELLFEGNKLASWETRLVPFVPTTDTSFDNSMSDWDPFPVNHSNKDTRHHRKGHDHHHD